MGKTLEIATFGGGCFWCTEAIFKRIRGVEEVVSGYAGGNLEDPTYDDVVSKETGHAESIQLEFDPTIISYTKILDIFFNLHDPTTLNQQENDIGTQYRSVIFYHDEKQKEIALSVRDEIAESGLYHDPIVTEIVPFEKFYTAEEYHQNYYDSNKSQGYCSYIIAPKIQKLLKQYDKDVKDEYKNSG